jgi:hypothetical protein
MLSGAPCSASDCFHQMGSNVMNIRLLSGKFCLVMCCLALAACEKKTPQPEQPTLVPIAVPAATELEILNWGPKSTPQGQAFNAQPDGSSGLWFEVSGGETIGEAQVLFGGQPALVSTVQPKLVTAGIAPEALAQPGTWEVSIKQLSTGKIFPAGTFTVEAAK